jgi:hypothetical protein
VEHEQQGGYRKHGHPAETVFAAGIAAFAAEAILPGGVPGWVLPAAEIIAAWGSAAVTWSFTGRKLFPAYMASLGAFLGGWTAWAQSAGLWHGGIFGAWLAGMAVMIPWGVSSWHRRHGRPAPQLALSAVPEPLMIEPEIDPAEAERQREMDLFATMFADFGITAGKDPLTGEPVPVRVTGLSEERWGRLVRIVLPKSGQVTIEDFRSRARNFEVALEAQEGAVMFESGSTSSEVIMKVRERDGMAGTHLLTPELRSRTVNEEIIIGFQEDDSYLKMPVREIHAMIVGTTGAGKSNLLNVIIAQLASCVDTVIWAIDMKGGRAIAPWFQAWEEGRTDRPPIDWIATTRAEAEMMMNAVVQAAETRMRSGIGRSKIKPTASLPQIILLCDEMADLFGDAKGVRSEIGEDAKSQQWFIRRGGDVTQKGRSEAVSSLWASQRGTTSMGASTDMKANIGIRIALRPSQESELQWIVPDLPRLATRQLAFLASTPGVGIMGRGPKASQPTKFIHHDHIEGVCGEDEEHPVCPPQCPVYQTEIDTAPVRPRLDQMTAAALGQDYAQRWVRAQRDGVLKVPAMALSGGSAAYGNGGDASRFDEIVRDIPDPEKELHPARIRMREYVAAQGIMGTSVKKVMDVLEHEGIGVARETVHRWFREDRDEDRVHHPSSRRWVAGPGENIEGDE